MPKESLEISQFRGMVGSADAHDLPLGAAAYAENLDTVQQQGLFTPLFGDTIIGATTYGKCDQVTPYDDGARAVLVDRAASDTAPTLRVVTIATMAQITSTATVRLDWDTAVSDGESVHVGMGASSTAIPKWVGTIFHQQFSAGSTGTQILDAEVVKADSVGIWADATNVRMHLPEAELDGTLKTWFNDEVIFHTGFTYVWLASVVYDSHQEGPLVVIGNMHIGVGGCAVWGRFYETGINASSAVDSDSNVLVKHPDTASVYTWQQAFSANPDQLNDVPATGLIKVVFDLRVRTARSAGSNQLLPRRITGINVYRAAIEGRWTSVSLLFSFNQSLPEPQHLAFIDINDSDWSSAAAGAASEGFDLTTETYRTFTFTDDYPGSDETFQSRTAYPATLEHMQVHYGVSCSADSYHIVGRCWSTDLLEIESWLFRSKPYRYDTFDWTKDYLVLPSEPNALVYWGGRVYAFADSRTYVINPGAFSVEDTWEGIGAPHRKSVIVTDRGMFWADSSNIYWHDGARVQIIGTPVLRNQYGTTGLEASWLDRTAGDPVLVYDARYDSVIVCYSTSAGAAGALMYHVAKGTWSFVTFTPADPFNTGFQAPDGRAYVALQNGANPKFYSLFTNPTKRSWKWVSPQIVSMAGKAKYFVARIATKVGGPTQSNIKFYDNDPTYTEGHEVSSLTSNIGSVKDAELTLSSEAWITMREFAMEITGTNAQDVTHISIIRRVIAPR